MSVKFKGTISQVTDLQSFATSYILTNGKPDAKTFKPFPNLTLHLALGFPIPFNFPSFLPQSSIKATTNSSGGFQFAVPSGFPESTDAYLIAYQTVMTVPGLNVPILAPVYRSATFKVGAISSAEQRIFVAPVTAPDTGGITQAQISAETKTAAKSIKDVESLTAVIKNDGIGVVAKGRGAEITFRIGLSPSTSHNLNQFVKHKIHEMDIDLPGPDWLTGLCVDEDQIEKEINQAIGKLVSGFQSKIKGEVINQIAAKSGQSTAAVKALFDSQVSLTFKGVRYPVVETKNIGPISFSFRSIVMDPCIGLPRKLFS